MLALAQHSKPFCGNPSRMLICLFLLHYAHTVLGGNCWLQVNKNGRCTALVKSGSTKEECCSGGPLASTASVAWNEEDLTPSSWFYMHVQGGVPCQRCKDSCEGVKCPDGQKCVVRNGSPKCVCKPNCSSLRLQSINGVTGRVKGPVCGSDGRTYKSQCRLLKRACRRKNSVTVSYPGPCRMTCSKMPCPGKKQCLMDQNMLPHCVNCSTRVCSVKKRPENGLCGVDGVSYPNICHLRQAACHKGKAIPVAYKGPCRKQANCSTVKCSEGQSCLVEIHSGKPRCVTCGSQPKWCKISEREGTMKGPICSNSGVTYKNWCDMMEDACNSGVALDTKHFGKCKESFGNVTNETTHF